MYLHILLEMMLDVTFLDPADAELFMDGLFGAGRKLAILINDKLDLVAGPRYPVQAAHIGEQTSR